MASSAKLLEMNNIHKTYRAGGLFSRKMIPAVRGVDIQMPDEPSILAVVGESGSGKSTLAKMVLRQERQTKGEIYLQGEAVSAKNARLMSDKDLRTKIQAIAQSPFDAFSSHLTVDYYLKRTAINLLGLKDKSAIQSVVD